MKVTRGISAKQLLELHWEKLAAELPDLYHYLVANAEAEGDKFHWPGLMLRRIQQDCESLGRGPT